MRHGWAGTAMLAFMALGGAAGAQELRIGSRTEPASPDPHYLWSGASTQFFQQYLGFLARSGPRNELNPGLAQSWRVVDDTTWEFTLRTGLVFDNGAPVTIADVIASLTRAKNMPNGSYSGLLSGVTEMAAVDDRTLRVVSSRPIPTLPNNLSQIAILPAAIAQAPGNPNFLSPQVSVGAGPYRFVEYRSGDRFVLERNESYRGPRARWQRVTFRFITANASRVAELLSGGVDVIDGVPTNDAATIRNDARFRVSSGPSDRAVYLSLDTERSPTPFITGPDGQPLDRNPLTDLRVRRAMSMAVGREAIRDRVMDGFSYPSNQIGSPALGGFLPDLPQTPFDPAAARGLLAEAGYPNGFSLALQCPSGRLVNDARICQVLGQMFQRIGIRTTVEVTPYTVFISRMTRHAGERGSVFMSTWASSYAGEVGGALEHVLHSYDREKAMGAWNLAHYANPEVDRLTEESMVVLDPQRRHALQGQAMRAAMEDVGVLPLHLQAVIMASRADLEVTIYSNEYTIADAVRPRGN